MTVGEVLKRLEKLGSAQTKKTWMRHGAKEPLFGCKVADLKVLVKALKTNHDLSLELFATGNADAMYFAGLISDGSRISDAELDAWAEAAEWYMIGEYSVAWTAADTGRGIKLGSKWIKSGKPHVAACGWATLGSAVAVMADADLPLKEVDRLLSKVAKEIGKATGRVAYTMNGFLIAVGCHVGPLSERALEVAEAIGPVHVDMGDTDCKVPLASEYIRKFAARGPIGRKRKNARC
jgi:hypothetical protein